MLQFDLENERVTIQNYRERIRQAEAMGEFALSEVLRGIIAQEQEHLMDLSDALASRRRRSKSFPMPQALPGEPERVTKAPIAGSSPAAMACCVRSFFALLINLTCGYASAMQRIISYWLSGWQVARNCRHLLTRPATR